MQTSAPHAHLTPFLINQTLDGIHNHSPTAEESLHLFLAPDSHSEALLRVNGSNLDRLKAFV